VHRRGTADTLDANPATQYTASSFAQPIRRVFGAVVFRAREHVDMPAPGALEPARLTVDMRDLGLGFPLRARRRRRELRRRSAQSSAVPDDPTIPQLGVRRARAPAAGACDMALILDLIVQGLQMLLVLLLARCSPDSCAR
jgi:hypothetical protein